MSRQTGSLYERRERVVGSMVGANSCAILMCVTDVCYVRSRLTIQLFRLRLQTLLPSPPPSQKNSTNSFGAGFACNTLSCYVRLDRSFSRLGRVWDRVRLILGLEWIERNCVWWLRKDTHKNYSFQRGVRMTRLLAVGAQHHFIFVR